MQRQRVILESVIIVGILNLLSHRLKIVCVIKVRLSFPYYFIYSSYRDLNCSSSVKSKKVDRILDFCKMEECPGMALFVFSLPAYKVLSFLNM